ncbi:hypothetical protein EYZ11_002359 [Aspergillus tanneri]|uniref:DUF7719 domain-containing protein n=1 Tax=Aspergillus tanneri TaxID=1220188 RepID=A0A4S3JR68_9EURO|nr:uncharacterized protein ATNIH1004_001498 [Aspergillus tanneri]KAA8652593.1 hypothetical protein ATNIH1004_001498 [Aspergillus tanneri]THC98135.1 hypothetical protein EYZ11_002359 [Aspergillus tanneri]
MDPPRNRKQRRVAAAAASSSNDSTFDLSSIPLAHPPRDTPEKRNGKTLVELIAERQLELQSQGSKSSGTNDAVPELGTRFVTVDPSTGEMFDFDASKHNPGSAQEIEEEGEDGENKEEPPIPPLIDTLLLSFPLTTLHLTLAYLAAHQYAEKVQMDMLLRESAFVTFPVLTFLIHLAHGHIVTLIGGKKGGDNESVSLFPWSRDKLSLAFLRRLVFPPAWRTLVFLPIAVFLGARLMAITNEEPYYAVMKRAPALGTIWVWTILEIPLGAAILGALGPMVWGIWWKGYSIL